MVSVIPEVLINSDWIIKTNSYYQKVVTISQLPFVVVQPTTIVYRYYLENINIFISLTCIKVAGGFSSWWVISVPFSARWDISRLVKRYIPYL